jgi:hypothetical protein
MDDPWESLGKIIHQRGDLMVRSNGLGNLQKETQAVTFALQRVL